jgi:hypothetical protein
MATENLQFNASAEAIDVAGQRKSFFELSGVLAIAMEDAQLKLPPTVIPIVLDPNADDVEVLLPAGITTGKLLCIKTKAAITVKRNSAGGEALPIGKWSALQPGGCLIGPTTFTSLFLSNSVSIPTEVELLIAGV